MERAFDIRPTDPGEDQVGTLLGEHLAFVALHSPPESIHAMDPDALDRPDVAFYGAWENATLVGCGALKALSPTHAEIKSMRTARSHLRRGVARAMLDRLLAEARWRGFTRVSLETGSADAFGPARALYAGVGFRVCGAFGGYARDPNSVFMTIELAIP